MIFNIFFGILTLAAFGSSSLILRIGLAGVQDKSLSEPERMICAAILGLFICWLHSVFRTDWVIRTLKKEGYWPRK